MAPGDDDRETVPDFDRGEHGGPSTLAIRARITLRLRSSYGVLMSRLWTLVLFAIGAAVPLVGGPIVVVLSGLGSPYGVNAMALFLVGGIYLPIGLLTAGGASGLRLLARRLSQSLTLEFAAIALGGAVGARGWTRSQAGGWPVAAP
jgi:hypothetical protein